MNRFTRSLHLEGATNFRDLGGYFGQDGRTVRWRRLFRSDHLAGLTPRDKTQLSDLGLRRVFDFRGVIERSSAECALDNATVYSLPIEPSISEWLSESVAAGLRPTAEQTMDRMCELYRNFANSSSHRYRELFEHLLESGEPLVFHCTAGKDRTGFAAAMILLALEVPRDVVLEDYMLTNRHLIMPVNPNSPLPPEVIDVLHSVQQDFLEAALQIVDSDYGGPMQFLENGLGVKAAERARLAELYLEPVA